MAHPVLVPVSQKGPIKAIPITSNKFLIGRGLHNEFVLEDVNISRTHCMLERHNNNKWNISDISSNGTWLNGQLIDKSSSHALSTGDIIGLSDSLKFVFKIQSDESSRAVGNSTKKNLTEDDILNIADSVIADVEAFQAECNSENFDETLFNNTTNNLVANCFNQAGSSSSNVNSVDVNNASALVNDGSIVGPFKSTEPTIAKLVQQPIISYLQQELPESKQVLPQFPLDVKPSSSSSSVVPQLDEQPNKAGSENLIAQPQTNNLEFAEDELQCSICTEMFVQAVTLSCSHTFCKYCIMQWQKNQSFCPICRQKITLQFPTRVIDNFIEKIMETASDDIKQHRQQLIDERQPPPTPVPVPVVATSSSSASTGRRRAAPDPIEISSAEENDDDDEFDEDMSDFSGSDSDEGWFEYNGLPGQYYGGYGHCFSCGQRGHWANGCPNKRR